MAEDVVEAGNHLADLVRRVILDADAGGEALAIAAKNQHADARGLLATVERAQHRLNFAHHLDVDDVERRFGQGDGADGAMALDFDGAEFALLYLWLSHSNPSE